MKKRFLPATIWSLIILYLSTTGGIQLPPSIWDIIAVDKVGHLVFYAIFCYLVLFGFGDEHGPFKRRNSIWSVSICFFFGCTIEFFQFSFFPDRYFEILDIAANFIGIIVGMILFYRLHKKLLQKWVQLL